MIDPKQGPLYLPHHERVPIREATPLGLVVRKDVDNVRLCFTARDGNCVEVSVERLAWDQATMARPAHPGTQPAAGVLYHRR